MTMSRDEIKARSIAAGVAAAQETAQLHGFRWGEIVAHPAVERACELRGIVGNTAYLLDAVEGMLEVPADGLFNPNIARDEAIRTALQSAVVLN